MKAGRELDWLVMEKVMGREIYELTETATFENAINHVPEFSTDIEAAWSLVQKVKELGFHFQLDGALGSTLWIVTIGNHVAQNSSAALAICVAALKAVGETKA